MRTRLKGYSDYGFTDGESDLLLKWCRRDDFPDEPLLLQCAIKSNPSIGADLFFSIRRSASYDLFERYLSLIYDKVDFYAYRRKALSLFRAELISAGRYPLLQS